MNYQRIAHNFSIQLAQGQAKYPDIELFSKVLEFSEGKTGNPRDIALDYLTATHGVAFTGGDLETIKNLLIFAGTQKDLKTYKVALLFICLNEPYWTFAKEAIEGAKKFFLPGHQTDMFFWTDMKESYGTTVFPTEAQPWPNPTLFRYNLFLQQEEKLKEYDYVFYCDIDMKFVNIVGDEVLGDGLTAAQHPGYALAQKFWIPYEPSPESSAYIHRPGKMIMDKETGQPKFMPLFYAGGFQGGKTEPFLKAMKVINENIDKDLARNYVALWNEQAHWNKYLFDNPPAVVLSPSYIYPDSLITEYYEKIWGCSYNPRLITLTKSFTVKPLTSNETKQLMNN